MEVLREEVAKYIKSNPKEYINLDNLYYDFYVKEGIKKGLKDIEEGRVTSHERFKEKFSFLK